jgi:multiple sugar transport system permease protein
MKKISQGPTRGATARQLRENLLTYGLVVLAAFIILPPVAWALLTSVKTDQNVIVYPPQWIPVPLTGHNYAAVFDSIAPRLILNTIIVALGTIAIVLILAFPAAYAASRFTFRGKEPLVLGLLGFSMIPGLAVLVPLFVAALRVGVINTYPLLMAVYSGWALPQVIWFLRGFIENIPAEMEEAGLIDGCSRSRVLWHITIPLLRPGIAAIAIFIFLLVWNDYLVALTLTTTEEMRLIQVGLVGLTQTGFGVPWGLFMAYTVIAFAPVLILFLGLQRWFISGLTSGGVKG